MTTAAVTVLTGAGISTAGGIPDFRGPHGVWTRDPAAMRLLDIDAYVGSADVRRAGWQAWADSPVWGAQPTPAHHALVELERAGMLRGLITQNFDGLHQAAGSDAGLLSEVHGSLRTTSCLACQRRCPTPEVLGRLAADPDPRCACGGVLKVDVVYFGQPLPADTFERAYRDAVAAEIFLAVGTTLTVQPVASLALEAVRAGAQLIVVNHDRTPYDTLATTVIRDDIDLALPRLVRDVIAEAA